MTARYPFVGDRPPKKADRPKCPGCSQPLKPTIVADWQVQKPKRRWEGNYQRYGAFCTLRCCEAYANFMFKLHGTMCVRHQEK